MRKNYKKNALSLALVIGLVSSTLSTTYLSLPSKVRAADVTSSKAEQILASLTKEQRDALNKLQAADHYGVQGFDKNELTSDKEISVVVEFKSKPEQVAVLDAALNGQELTAGEARSEVNQDHATFENDLTRILPTSQEKSGKGRFKVTHSFKTAYNGVSMKLPANEVESLLQSDAVQAVYKSVPFSIDPPLKSESGEEQGSTKRIESIPFLGVDKLHKEGYTGKGVKVGVIDTGIDYNHPDLKDAFKGGYDFVDNDNDPMETTYDDWVKAGKRPPENGGTYYTEHGTHVSGTIAGQAKNTGGVAVEGIAPDADLYVYRVLGPNGSGYLEDILAGIDKAVLDGMDVINLSLGANIDDPFYPTSTAVNNAVLSGVTAVVSAGNSGPGSYTLGSPGAAALALTVGASSTPIPVTKYKGVLSDSDSAYDLSNLYTDYTSDLKDFNNQTLDVVYLGAGQEKDYLNKDVTGKIVFVDPGFWQSLTIIAKKHGARALLAYNNRPNEGTLPFVREDSNFIPAFSMSYEQGLDFKEKLASGHNKITFNNFKEINTDGDKLASFSSRGPSRVNYDIKPEITAPGVSVLSSIPAFATYNNDSTNYQYAYDRMNGTSMAAPHVTGIAALLLQANPNLQPGDIKTILMNTAKPLADKYSVFEVGAGRVDPYRAIHSGMKLQVQDKTMNLVDGKNVSIKEETGGLSFGNYYANEKNLVEKSINIENLENKTKKFDVDGQFQTDVTGANDANANGVILDVAKTIQVQSFKSKKVPVSITVPANAQAGIYEGYLILTNQDDKNEQYRIPFGVHTTDEGFNLTTLSSPSISPQYLQVKRTSATYLEDLNFNFKSPMKKLDLVLVDGKTGNDIGYIGAIDTSSAYDGLTYNIKGVFDGTYFAFTGDQDQPISSKKSYVKPGYYKIKTIGTNLRDRMFTSYNDLFIDVNAPKMTTSLDNYESPVIEYQPEQKTVPVEVKVTDEEQLIMNTAGKKATNKLNYSINGNVNPVIPLEEDETMKLNVQMNTSPFWRFTLNGLDSANNSTLKKNYYFVKAGTPYGYMKTDKMNLKTGDTVSTTLVLNNVDKLKNAEWTLSNIGQNFEIIDAKPNAALADYGTSTVNIETTGNNSKVKLALNGEKSVSGNIPAVNLTLKVKDTAFAVSAAVNPTVTYTNELGTSTALSSAGMEWTIQPTFSELSGSLRAEATVYNSKWNWTTAGASIQLIDANGNKYDGTSSLVSYGDYRITKLPLTNKPFVWLFKLPGHFTTKIELPIGVERNGEVLGQLIAPYFNTSISAGDVNNDDVIDVLDAIYIQTYWGTNKRAADINFDGVVDTKDLALVEKNYLLQNPTNTNSPTPKKKYKSQTLETVKSALGIQ